MKFKFSFCFLGSLVLGLCTHAQAGVFNLPHRVSPGSFAIGVEPEITIASGASLGVNLKYTHGVSELSNFSGMIGSGGGSRQFKFGGAWTFDLFPDTESQPGIGVAVQGLFVQLQAAGSAEITVIPYLHKTLILKEIRMEPFFAVPVGLSLSQGNYRPLATLAVGSFFNHSVHIRSLFEMGIGLGFATSYLSGGLIYFY